MANITATAPSELGDSLAQKAFGNIEKCVALFGAISAIVLGTVAVMAFTHHDVTSFMGVRGAILLAITPLLLRYVSQARSGSYPAFDRVRTLATIMPIPLIAVDLIPGLCPVWSAVLQGLSALALVAVAVVTRGSALRAAFPKK